MPILIEILLWILFTVLALNVSYFLFFSMGSLIPRKPQYAKVEKYNNFLVMIPAYKGDEVIIHTVEESFKQNYPQEHYRICVIADQLQPETIKELNTHPVSVVEVKFEKSTKSKSLNAALDAMEGSVFDYVVLLDIDNIMDPAFLEKMNALFQHNEVVVQGHRMAKNLDTPFAILDAISEEINNSIFRKGHYKLGLSSALIGSGKAMRYDIFRDIMRKIDAVGGFDKEMEIYLISSGIRIGYDHTAIVLDEKVQLPEVFQNQRRRWLSAQLAYMKKFAFKGIIKGIFTFKPDLLDKSIQLTLLPRAITIGTLGIFGALYFVGFEMGKYFLMLLALNILAMWIALPRRFYHPRYLKAIFYFPSVFMLMFMNFFKLKGANKTFIHTPHQVNQVKKK
jgi:cellulose synthase/poly-beta-1,6-N-acetylglucosamine synthase-like glycosyltransferase